MVKHTQTICWQQLKNCLCVFDHFVGLVLNPLSANAIKWSNTLKQFVGKLLTNCLNVFDHFVKLVLKGLRIFTGKTLMKNTNMDIGVVGTSN